MTAAGSASSAVDRPVTQPAFDVVVVDAAVADPVVVVVVDPAAAAAAAAAADGVKVAVKGVRSGVGSTTGIVSTARVRVGVPNCTVVVPDTWMF